MNRNEYVQNSNSAIIILHEIYGLNKHIEDVCKHYFTKGYDIYCPDLLNKTTPFDYSQSDEAYHYFISCIGFDINHKVDELIEQLKKKYEKVFIIGYSIGATIAWRCTSNIKCDGIIGFYGSRIRDYLEVNALSPSLLLFADEDSFNVISVVEILEHKQKVTVGILEGKHGFLDKHSDRYHLISSEKAMEISDQFLYNITNDKI